MNAKTFRRGAGKPSLGWYSFSPGEPTTVEFESWIDEGYMLQIAPEGLYETDEKVKDVGPENYSGPGLAILRVEVEGPILERYPLEGHALIFEGLDRKEIMPRNPKDREKTYYKPKFEIIHEDESAALRPVLMRVARAAFRRPVTAEQIAPYEALFLREREAGSDFEQALRTAVTAIFCSPDFLYLKENPGALDDWALASRLSYFLTRTAPDARLRELAAKGELSANPDTLMAEVDRLLADPRSDRFITDFTDAWLDLRNIEFTAPDTKLFPEFDRYLQLSMVEETRLFLRELIRENLPVTSLVKSDFAMLNERLAEHYGIEGVAGPEIRRVSLPADSVRGGFLAQGSVLKVSANGTNTSPIVRGAWVLERILGVTPPPPPPAVPGVEPDIRGAETLRQLLDKHRSMESCQGCHQLIDPPGFALEGFNPIGGWRKQFRTLSKDGPKPDVRVRGRGVQYRIGLPVDDSGVLLDGRSFDGYRTFRDYLAADEKRLARTLVKKLLMFSTGREMGFSDRPEINRLAQHLTDEQGGVRDLMQAVITSDIFRHK